MIETAAKGVITLMKRTAIILVPLLAMSQSACIAVGGYSSSGGWFIWPGGLGLILLLVFLFFFLRR